MGSHRDSAGSLEQARRRRADRARQVADVLRHQVLAGSFPHGQLPREAQLCRDFDVSRNTVRAALALLADEGLVERSPGIGTTGCTLCVDMCPLDSLAIDPETSEAFMHVDECCYCGPCAARCPTGAVTVNMPFLIR